MQLMSSDAIAKLALLRQHMARTHKTTFDDDAEAVSKIDLEYSTLAHIKKSDQGITLRDTTAQKARRGLFAA